MAETYYNNPRKLTINGVEVVIEANRMKHGVKRDLRNYFSNYSLDRETGMFEGVDIPTGAIESIAVRRGLSKMWHAGHEVQFNSADPIDDYPEIGMGDEDGDVDLYEEVLKTIIDKNRFLARTYPFSMVFAQYLAMVNQDKADYEKKRLEATGAEQDNPVNPADPKDTVGLNPTQSQEDTSTVRRISSSDLAAPQ